MWLISCFQERGNKLVEAAGQIFLSFMLDSIGCLLFVFVIAWRLLYAHPQAPEHVTRHTHVQTTLYALHHASHSPSHSRGGHVKDERVKASVEGAEEQSLVSPGRICPSNITNDVREVIGAKTWSKHQQCSKSHANGPQASATVNVMQLGQDPDKADVAESANKERDAEEHEKDLQAHREKDF